MTKKEENITYEIDNCEIIVKRIFDESKSIEDIIQQLLKNKK